MTKYSEGGREGDGGGWGVGGGGAWLPNAIKPNLSNQGRWSHMTSKPASGALVLQTRRSLYGRGGIKKGFQEKQKWPLSPSLSSFCFGFFFSFFLFLRVGLKYFQCYERISTTSHCTWRSRAASCSAPMPPALCKDLCAVKSAIEQCYDFLSFPFPVSVFPHM